MVLFLIFKIEHEFSSAAATYTESFRLLAVAMFRETVCRSCHNWYATKQPKSGTVWGDVKEPVQLQVFTITVAQQ